MFALFYDESVRDPIIVFDIERQRVLDGPIRDVRVLGDGKFAIDGIPYSMQPTGRLATFACQSQRPGESAPPYHVFLADQRANRLRGISELPHIESEAEAVLARQYRRDTFFVLQKPQMADGFEKDIYYNTSSQFDSEAYKRGLPGFTEVFGLALLYDAITHAPNLVQCADGYFLREPMSTSQWTTRPIGSAIFSQALGWVFYAEPRDEPPKHIAGCSLVLTPHNWSHWHVQNLPALYGLAELVHRGVFREDEVNVVISDHADVEILHYYLDLLDIHPRIFDPFHENFANFTSDCTVIATSADTPWGYRWSPYIGKALSILRQPAERREKVLFISRDDVHNRRGLINESEVLGALEDAGIPVSRIAAMRLSYSEQRRRFAEAKLVIGPHGSGLINAVYSDAQCGVVEIISDTQHPNRAWYHKLFGVLGHPYAAVNCPAGGSDWDAPYSADPALIVAAIRELESAVQAK